MGMRDDTRNDRPSRREFIKTAVFGGLASAVAAGPGLSCTGNKREEKGIPKIRRYRKLGRTGFEVSDVSSGDPNDAGVLRFLLDAGVNYFDTAESYAQGERMYGDMLEGIDRRSVFITTKLVIGHRTDKEHFIERTRRCLERIRSDYIDCMMVHMPPTVTEMLTPGFHEAIDELQREGRVRFRGVSHHGSYYDDSIREPMDRIMLTAIEDGRFDVILPTYNFLNEHEIDRVLAEAARKKIGTVVMKSNPVGHYYDFKGRVESMRVKSGERYEHYKRMAELAEQKTALTAEFIERHGLENPEEVRDAALRFVISNDYVNTVILSISTFEEAERFVGLSGSKLGSRDRGMLDDYRDRFGDLYCRHGCGRCEPYCPHGVPVNTIMRYYHYFDAQGREKEAMGKYAELPARRADFCRNCEGWCEAACPYGVRIQGLLCIGHDTLTLA